MNVSHFYDLRKIKRKKNQQSTSENTKNMLRQDFVLVAGGVEERDREKNS